MVMRPEDSRNHGVDYANNDRWFHPSQYEEIIEKDRY